MPKQTKYLLIWSAQAHKYEVQIRGESVPLPILPESLAWVIWLDEISSFSFHSKEGHICTVRKEQVQRGNAYWYGYRRKAEKAIKCYLGRSADLTMSCLEQIAVQLNTPTLSISPEALAPLKVAEQLSSSQDTVETEVQEPHAYVSMSTLINLPLNLQPATKFYIPRLREQLVHRPHLVKQLQQGMAHALTLISAPAGSGKTTLLAQWLFEGSVPVAWLSLGPEDNDPACFFTSVIAALRSVAASIGTSALALLRTSGFSQVETVLALIINDLVSEIEQDVALVLDDYHAIEDATVHRGMTFLLEHLPLQMHLFLATRVDPPLPLARLRAKGELAEVRATDLSFNVVEAGTFLGETMGLTLSHGEIEMLESRTEGWVTGLQLIGLLLKSHYDLSRFLTDFTTYNRFVVDYLNEEVFCRQPKYIQHFLLHTAIADRLSGPLCDILTNDKNGQMTLERLEQINLFLIPLDLEKRWYRYHQLFRDFLRRRLEETYPEKITTLYQRASVWCEQNHLITEAVDYALAASDVERVAQLIVQIGRDFERNGEVAVVSHWLDKLPEQLIRLYPELCRLRCWLCVAHGQLGAAEIWLHDAKKALPLEAITEGTSSPDHRSDIEPDEVDLFGTIFTLEAYIAISQGDIARCIEVSTKASRYLTEQHVFMQSVISFTLGVTYTVMGNAIAAAKAFKDASIFSQMAGNDYILLLALCGLASTQVAQGYLLTATETYQQAQQLTRNKKHRLNPYAGMAQVGLAGILYEWNDLDTAADHLIKSLDTSRRWGNKEYIAYGCILFAAVKEAQSNSKGAMELFDQVNEQMSEYQLPIWCTSFVAACQTRLLLRQGKVEEATKWARKSFLGEFELVTQIRLFIAQRQPQKALEVLAQQLPLIDASQHRQKMIEFRMLQALAHYQCGNIPESILVLQQSLSMAEAEGYIRLFVDMGEPMAVLLSKVLDVQRRKRNDTAYPVSSSYIRKLLSILEKSPEENAYPKQGEKNLMVSPLLLTTPLREREIEVIRYIAAGMSNNEIARQLVVAKSTVQWHIKNVYAKLHIHNRTQLIIKARELGLSK